MSLDVYLTSEPTLCDCPTCGKPGHIAEGQVVYSGNITHNLNKMADEAGIYELLWRPEEIGVTKARQIIAPLEIAIADMVANRDKYAQHSAPNGWGTYDQFIPWLEDYLRACKENPEANVSVSR